MQRYLSLALLLAPALSTAIHAASHDVPAAASTGRLDGLWLVVSAAGLRVSQDDGRHWTVPRGLPPQGSFYDVVADVPRPGTAFITNGDVYSTANGGRTWVWLGRAPGRDGPAGLTTLAVDPRNGVLYAGGAVVVAYLPARHRWQVWGRGWPAVARPTVLLATRAHGLYAGAIGHAARVRLYHTVSGTAPWHSVPTPPWHDAPITAMALGPDGVTPYLAVRGHGVWYVARSGTLHQLGPRLPTGAAVDSIQSDPFGADLYVATDQGLFARHLNTADDLPHDGNTWRPVAVAHDPIVALGPWRRGLLAVAQSGILYEGTQGKGQALVWHRLEQRLPIDGAPVVGALAGAEWQAPPPPPPLPEQFTRCLSFGPSPGQAFDVCGPFRAFYLHFRYPVFGWPRGRAVVLGHGVVRQVFDNVWLEWTARRGVYLAPLGRMAAGRRAFPHPTPRQVREADTAYIGGYYVEPLFYDFWRRYGGVAVFGDPISQRASERSTNGTGQKVPVQYFTNVRLEYHVELPPGSQVQLSNLGERR
jgi:hypothetical protein